MIELVSRWRVCARPPLSYAVPCRAVLLRACAIAGFLLTRRLGGPLRIRLHHWKPVFGEITWRFVFVWGFGTLKSLMKTHFEAEKICSRIFFLEFAPPKTSQNVGVISSEGIEMFDSL